MHNYASSYLIQTNGQYWKMLSFCKMKLITVTVCMFGSFMFFRSVLLKFKIVLGTIHKPRSNDFLQGTSVISILNRIISKLLHSYYNPWVIVNAISFVCNINVHFNIFNETIKSFFRQTKQIVLILLNFSWKCFFLVFHVLKILTKIKVFYDLLYSMFFTFYYFKIKQDLKCLKFLVSLTTFGKMKILKKVFISLFKNLM